MMRALKFSDRKKLGYLSNGIRVEAGAIQENELKGQLFSVELAAQFLVILPVVYHSNETDRHATNRSEATVAPTRAKGHFIRLKRSSRHAHPMFQWRERFVCLRLHPLLFVEETAFVRRSLEGARSEHSHSAQNQKERLRFQKTEFLFEFWHACQRA